MKIGIIIGSTRDGRNGEAVAQWVLAGAQQHGGAEFDLIDLKAFDVPMLTSAVPPSVANKRYDDERVNAWSRAIDACDAFVFVTPEYNRSVPGPFKNAFDSLGQEWAEKPVGFVSYGADGGIRAVEHWRPIVSNFNMVAIRPQVSLGLFSDFTSFAGGDLTPTDRRAGELTALLERLVATTTKLAG